MDGAIQNCHIRFPVMFQSWNVITFLHWRYDAEVLRPHLPAGLDLDCFQDSAWVSLTPFRVEGLRPPFFPTLPWISYFPEMNLRTYVTGPAGPGIWFFSLDAARLAAVVGARLTYSLPYYWAKMKVRVEGARVDYRSSRGKARAWISVNVGDPIARKDPLAVFLTERYRLYGRRLGRLAFAEVEHPPWPLYKAKVVSWEESVRAAAGLPAMPADPIAQYSPGVDVRIGRLRKSIIS